MGKKIVVTGRGGTGKSTFTALSSRYLASPILLIDIDPDQSLAEMLGIDLEKEGVRTISDALYQIIEDRRHDGGNPMPLHDRMDYLLNRECLYEGKRFDLIVLGTKLTEGCYCVPDDLIKTIIPRLADYYPNVVIDSPAGLEHLNRKIVSDIDNLFVILDPSSKSLKHIARIRDITEQIGISYSRLYLVGNYNFDNATEEYLESTGETYLGKIEYDTDVQGYNLAGKSLLGLPENSPACLSVRTILSNAAEIIGGDQAFDVSEHKGKRLILVSRYFLEKGEKHMIKPEKALSELLNHGELTIYLAQVLEAVSPKDADHINLTGVLSKFL